MGGPTHTMKITMSLWVTVPVDMDGYTDSFKNGEPFPKGADKIAEKELIRMIESGNLNWEWDGDYDR
jgi:hypothetical protein